jgi:hypothetical protein
MILIRRFHESDWPEVWCILRATFQAGDSYAFSPDSTEAEIHKVWVDVPSAIHLWPPMTAVSLKYDPLYSGIMGYRPIFLGEIAPFPSRS